jgi:hypothetical protein
MTDAERKELHEAFIRSIAADKGETPADEGQAETKVKACVDPWTGKTVATYKEDPGLAEALTNWTAGAMGAKAALHRGKLPKGQIVSYHTRQTPDQERFGKVTIADRDVQVKEFAADDKGKWSETGNNHFIRRDDIHGLHSDWPSVEAKANDINRAVARMLFKR